ncbi:hypothetical protein HDV64DRAFT_75739 [Trichoderma sp. TUCIM 5745]
MRESLPHAAMPRCRCTKTCSLALNDVVSLSLSCYPCRGEQHSLAALSPWGDFRARAPAVLPPRRCALAPVLPIMCPLQRRIDFHPTPPVSGPNLHPSNISLPLPDFTSRRSRPLRPLL